MIGRGDSSRAWWRTAIAVTLLFSLSARLGAQADGLHVRTGTRDVVVPWVTSNGARYLPITAVARALGGTVQTSKAGIALDACGVVARFVIGQRTVDLASAGP